MLTAKTSFKYKVNENNKNKLTTATTTRTEIKSLKFIENLKENRI